MKRLHVPILVGFFWCISPVTGLGAGYGLGWGLLDYDGHKVLLHTGGIDGFGAMVVVIPDMKSGFALLANSDETKVTKVIPRVILDYLIKGGPLP